MRGPEERTNADDRATIRARIARALADARRELIDLSRRNRLLHATRVGKRPHCLDIRGAQPDALFRDLVTQSKSYAFFSEKEQEDLGSDSARASDSRRTLYLRTSLSEEALDRRLLKFYREARSFEEEQGVNILFVALGFLKWFEDPAATEASFAPLVLVPVTLERKQGKNKFLLHGREDDLMVNESLREKLRVIAGVDLPDIPEGDDWSPTQYFSKVASAVEAQRRWEVDGQAAGLGFFTFSKFLMWRDLDASKWPDAAQLLTHPVVTALLGEDQQLESSNPIAADDEPIDRKIDLASAIHVLNADSSQALVVEEARRQNNLVVQGPPGTGKSQTIANIIATAVHAGRSVLFVAEKAAALEVVHSRLKSVGLEALCLEIHSRKATKQAVIDSLRRSLQTAGVASSDLGLAPSLRKARDRLNSWSEKLHTAIGRTSRTPYLAMGTILKLQTNVSSGWAGQLASLDIASDWNEEQLRSAEERIDRTARACARLGTSPRNHPWFGTNGKRLTPIDLGRLTSALDETRRCARSVTDIANNLQTIFAVTGESCMRDVQRLSELCRLLQSISRSNRAILGHPAWQSERSRIVKLVETGRKWAQQEDFFRKVANEKIWATDFRSVRTDLVAHGSSLLRFFFRQVSACGG